MRTFITRRIRNDTMRSVQGAKTQCQHTHWLLRKRVGSDGTRDRSYRQHDLSTRHLRLVWWIMWWLADDRCIDFLDIAPQPWSAYRMMIMASTIPHTRCVFTLETYIRSYADDHLINEYMCSDKNAFLFWYNLLIKFVSITTLTRWWCIGLEFPASFSHRYTDSIRDQSMWKKCSRRVR